MISVCIEVTLAKRVRLCMAKITARTVEKRSNPSQQAGISVFSIKNKYIILTKTINCFTIITQNIQTPLSKLVYLFSNVTL